MQEFVQLIALGALIVGFSAAIVARIRKAWLIRTILLLLFAPAIPMVLIFGLGALSSPATGSGLYGLVFIVMLIGTIILLPWIVACGAGILIGLALRGKRPPEPAAVATPVQPPLPSVPASLGNKEIRAPGPGPFAAWRIALVILIGALAAIAGLTYLSMTYDIDPPKVPAMPYIPRSPG